MRREPHIWPLKRPCSDIHLDSVDIGYMQLQGRRIAAFVFRSKGRVFSFTAADGGNPETTLKSSIEPLQKMERLSGNPGALRLAIIDSGRIGDGPKDYQTSVNFLAGTNGAALPQIEQQGYHAQPLLIMWQSWTNQEPPMFQKTVSYKVNAVLFMSKEP